MSKQSLEGLTGQFYRSTYSFLKTILDEKFDVKVSYLLGEIRIVGCCPLQTVESLQSHMILTMPHWFSGLTCLLPAKRGTYVKPGFSC